jgi:gamma-glutamylcyclotransferase (GGCT)/AIG2-like uncharacterized protein YtfP
MNEESNVQIQQQQDTQAPTTEAGAASCSHGIVLSPGIKCNECGDTSADKQTPHGIRVFVYGTLKRGEANHGVLEGSEFLGECAVGTGYKMVDLGWYPGVIRGVKGAGEVYGEVYLVDEPTLHSLDAIEGHPNYYTRYKIATPFKNAWIYTLPAEYADEGEEVAGGKWHGRAVAS